MAVVQHPGARGGKFWIDANGNTRYGEQPGMTPRAAATPPVPIPPAEGMADHPDHNEFGAWSHDATSVYLRQALRYAPCIVNIIRRYLEMVSRYGMGAAAEAFKLMTPADVPPATAALGRIRRLARWDRFGRVKAEGTGTPLPSGHDANPQATARDPFVRQAMQAGMPQDAALLWQQIALRAMNRNRSGVDFSDLLLEKSRDTAIWAGALLLRKAVMNPGSRGGHVYWKNGRLHYGYPTGPVHRHRKGGGVPPGNQPPGPSPLALALMRQGRRIQFRDLSGKVAWGEVITATGDMLAVAPDDAPVYDLLHTICVPVQAVLKVERSPQERDEQQQVAKSLGGDAVADQPGDGAAEDDSCWPQADQ